MDNIPIEDDDCITYDADECSLENSDDERTEPPSSTGTEFQRKAFENQPAEEVSNHDVYPIDEDGYPIPIYDVDDNSQENHSIPIYDVDDNSQENSGGERFEPPSSKESQGISAAEFVINLTSNDGSNRNARSLPSDDIIIPNGIREIMCGLPNPVLNVNALEAFFNQVKGRPNSKVAVIAKEFHYTNDIEELRQQLKDTVKKYYEPPISSSPEDKKFVMWIEKFLKRF